MSKKRSDALQALVAEVVDLEADIEHAREREETARIEFTAAQQVLANYRDKRAALEERRTITSRALSLIQERDLITDETVDALKVRARA